MSIQTTYVFLSSSDSIAPTTPSICSWNINVPIQEYTSARIQLKQASFPVSVYAFNSNRANQTLIFEEKSASTTSTVTIVANNYTGAQLATHLASIMTAGSQQGNTFTVTYDSQSKKLTFTSDITNWRITSTSTCLRELGLTNSTGMSVAVAQTVAFISPNLVKLDGTSYVDIMSSVSVRNFHTKTYSNILARIYLTQPFGNVQIYEDASPSNMRFYGYELNNISIQLRGDRGELYNLPENDNLDLTFALSY